MDKHLSREDRMEARTADVVIVGSRCAGAPLARLLAQAGLDVVVVDRAAFPSDTVSTHSIAGHGSRLLERWGLRDRVLATGVPNPHTMGVRAGAVDLPELPPIAGSLGSLSPRRTVLDALLLDSAREAGADVWERAPVRALMRNATSVTGVLCTKEGKDVEVLAPVVIGADGRHSQVARAVDAAWYDVRPSNLGGVYAYYADTGLEHNEVGLADKCVTLAFVTNDDLTCVAVGMADDRAREVSAGGDEAVLEIARRSAPRVAHALEHSHRVGRFTAYRAEPARFVQSFGPGWALVGDAGHYKDPISGQGIADAFVSAQLLSEAIIDGLGGAVPIETAMDAYQSLRDSATAAVHDVTARLSLMGWSDDEVVHLFLEYKDAVAAADKRVRAMATSDVAGSVDVDDELVEPAVRV